VRRALLALLSCGCFHPYGGGEVPEPERPPPPAPAAAPAAAQRIEDQAAAPAQPRERTARTITLRLLADEQVGLDAGWREKADVAVGLASQPFRALKIAFKVTSTARWETPPGEDSLPMLLERAAQQPKGDADVVVGLVAGPELLPGPIDRVGWAQYPEDVAVVRWAAPETLGRVLAHELGHLLGAVHVEEPGSLMRASLPVAGSALDRYNTDIVDANRDRRFDRGRPPLTEEQAEWAIEAVQKILRDDRHNRDAEDMRTLLYEYKIRLKAWQREGSGNDEPAARRKAALALVDEGRRHLQERRRGQGLAFLREALRTDARCPGAHLALGKDLYERGQPEEALADLFAEVDVDPKSALAFYLIGLCHEHAGRAAQAREAFSTALRLDPNLSAARAKVGVSPATP
jgi:tetratricopeptide repeat protein